MDFLNRIVSFLTGPLNTVAWLYIFLPCAVGGGLYLTIRNNWISRTEYSPSSPSKRTRLMGPCLASADTAPFSGCGSPR